MDKKCIICNNIFYVKPSQYERRLCCSKTCQNENQKNKTGILNNNYKGGVKVQVCNFCKKEFIPKNKYQIRKYCSHKCSSDHRIGIKITNRKPYTIKIKETNPNKVCGCGNKKEVKSKSCYNCRLEVIKNKRKKSKCLNCNKTIIKVYNNKKYCDRKCFGEHKQIINLGDKNPNWKNGSKLINQKERNTKKHNDWIRSVFIRDNFTCKKCQKKGGKLNAHHFYPWAKFKDLRFDLNNGITLCEPCHKNIHKIKDPLYINV